MRLSAFVPMMVACILSFLETHYGLKLIGAIYGAAALIIMSNHMERR